MARVHRFVVEMSVPDDDHTDPEDMVPIIAGVLNCVTGYNADWLGSFDEMIPEARPVFTVTDLDTEAGRRKVQ